MDTNRTVALWESPYDLHKLSDNGFSFCIAKSVIDSQGNLTYNLVWKSLALSPRSTVTWTVQYGLNWTLDIPTGNAQVTIGGIWQACDPGQVFDVDKFGLFQPSSVASRPGFLTVGKNNYRYDGTSGIHIIVGVQTPAGDFEAVSRLVNVTTVHATNLSPRSCLPRGMIDGLDSLVGTARRFRC
jgi:hypothetical protein